MKNKEALAFDMWKSQAPDSFKRAVLLELYILIRRQHNQTFSKLFFELHKKMPNVTESDALDALTSLRQFSAIGTYPVKGKGAAKDAFHVNIVKSKQFDEYLDYIEQNFPHLM